MGAASASEDDFNIIVVGTTYCEVLTRRLLEQNLAKPNAIKWDNFGLAARIDLLVAMDVLHEESAPLIRRLNTLRNRFAHDIDAKLEEADVEHLLDGIHPGARKTFDVALANEMQSFPTRAKYKHELRAFVLIATVFLEILLNEEIEAAQQQFVVREQVLEILRERGGDAAIGAVTNDLKRP